MEIGWFGVAGHRPLDYRGWAASYVWCWGVMQNAVITPAIETFTRLRSGLWKKTRLCLCGAGGGNTETAWGNAQYPRIDYARRAPEKDKKTAGRRPGFWRDRFVGEGRVGNGMAPSVIDSKGCQFPPSFVVNPPSLTTAAAGVVLCLSLSSLS